MHEKLIWIALALFSVLLLRYLLQITGFTVTSIAVAVQERISGKLMLEAKPLIELGSSQNIYTEFINTGASGVIARIEVRVHTYTNWTLKPIAYYYDSSVKLNPGMRRGFRTVFVPSSTGLYYIQARGYYDNRVVEVWSAFTVYYPTAVQPVPVYYEVPVTAPPPPAKPGITIEYPEKVKILQGESILTSILVKNTGEALINNLRMYVSTSALFNFSVNPKQIARLPVGASIVFLVLIGVPKDMPVGEYPFDFELISGEVKESRRMLVEVVSIAPPEEEGIYQEILNYEFLVSEIEREIAHYHSQGYDVRQANESLINARRNLQAAKEYFRMKEFEKAKEELQKVRKYLQDAVFQLASATLYVYVPRAFIPYWVLLLVALIIVAIVVAYYYKKRSERRPKLLRAMTEETEK